MEYKIDSKTELKWITTNEITIVLNPSELDALYDMAWSRPYSDFDSDRYTSIRDTIAHARAAVISRG